MRAWREVAVWWAILVVVWLGTVSVVTAQEWLAAAVLAVPCAVAARHGRRAAGAHWAPGAGWTRWLLALPQAVLHDTAAMLVLAVRGDRTSEDGFAELPLPDDDAGAGREALATVVLSATPGSVVVDAHDQRLTVHTVPIGHTRLAKAVRR
jgi:multisubunit Na+/H+ antiporter MnhE subunit